MRMIEIAERKMMHWDEATEGDEANGKHQKKQ